jgi:hypothetical protein
VAVIVGKRPALFGRSGFLWNPVVGIEAWPKEFAQILPIFLPFPKMDAVESAPSEENG